MSQDEKQNEEVRGERFGSTVTSAQFSQCLNCVHWDADAQRECEAFEGMKVPLEIIDNRFDHREPHPDDNGTQFEPIDEDAEHPMDVMQQQRPS